MNSEFSSGQSVSVILPTMNEELAARKVISDIQHELPDAEIIVIDSSSDKTAEIAKELGCVVLKQFPSKGQDLAMIEGFKIASREIIVTLDCDDTYPVESIKPLLKLIAAGYDVASASRLGCRPKTMPFSNYVANKLLVWMAWIICGVRSTDIHTGMRAYRRDLFLKFPFCQTGRAALAVELQVGPMCTGYRCAEINITYHSRIGESKLHRLDSTFWTLKRLWRWRWFANDERKSLMRSVMP